MHRSGPAGSAARSQIRSPGQPAFTRPRRVRPRATACRASGSGHAGSRPHDEQPGGPGIRSPRLRRCAAHVPGDVRGGRRHRRHSGTGQLHLQSGPYRIAPLPSGRGTGVLQPVPRPVSAPQPEGRPRSSPQQHRDSAQQPRRHAPGDSLLRTRPRRRGGLRQRTLDRPDQLQSRQCLPPPRQLPPGHTVPPDRPGNHQTEGHGPPDGAGHEQPGDHLLRPARSRSGPQLQRTEPGHPRETQRPRGAGQFRPEHRRRVRSHGQSRPKPPAISSGRSNSPPCPT